MDEILQVRGVSKSYGNQKVINDIDFSINRADIYGFLGPNGAGKSTTVKMILGLVHPDKGEILIDDYSISSNRKQALQSVGAVVEAPSFYNHMSAYQNLKLYVDLYNINKKRIDEVLEVVGLSSEKTKKVKKYSMGMKQRLGIARAILNNPKFIILDEPTNGLDPKGVIEIRNLIKSLAHIEQTTFLICSHILNEVQNMCNKISIIDKGIIRVSGNVNDLIEKSSVNTLEEYYMDVFS